MKHFRVFVVVSLCCFQAGAQVWIDRGAEWHYDFSNIGMGGFYKYEYVKDTLILGRNCQKISGTVYCFGHDQYNQIHLLWKNKLADQFTSVSGDTVFYLNNGRFFILYNFGASPGDTWVVSTENLSGYCDDTSKIVVTDTGKITINASVYRYITVEPTSNSPQGFRGTYVERFGNIDTLQSAFQFLFPYSYGCDSLPYIAEWDMVSFKCYSDTSFGLYNPSGQHCEYYLTLGGNPDAESLKMRCYPNPTKGSVYFERTDPEVKRVLIYNPQGILMRSVELTSDFYVTDISGFQSGIYFIRYVGKNADHGLIRIIKE